MMKSDVGKRLREARWKAGLSRKKVVELAGNRISERTILNIEEGREGYEPLPQSIYILAAALDLDPKQFFEEEVAS